MTTLILGAGLSGLSISYFLQHINCSILEQNSYCGGHLYSYSKNNYTWDEGPHVSFTKNALVKKILSQNVNNSFFEFEAKIANFYQGYWVPHPIQSHLYALQEPLRTAAFESFLAARSSPPPHRSNDYNEWLNYAMGKTLTDNFVELYTNKYWTCSTKDLTVEWIGERVYFPDESSVRNGYKQDSVHPTHYITSFRYPQTGGFNAYTNNFSESAKIVYNSSIQSIDLRNKVVHTSTNSYDYNELIVTIPLPKFIELLVNVPAQIKEASGSLACTSVLLVNIEANHGPIVPYNWFYIYDKELYSTRVSQTSLLSPNNSPIGTTGIQVEVYESKYKPFTLSHDTIAAKVVEEMKGIGILKSCIKYHYKYVKYANVIFDHNRESALNKIWSWLEDFGLQREDDELSPTISSEKTILLNIPELAFAGRFAQWKYYWTDDCILRAIDLSRSINSSRV